MMVDAGETPGWTVAFTAHQDGCLMMITAASEMLNGSSHAQMDGIPVRTTRAA
jgi:hypothetical protein